MPPASPTTTLPDQPDPALARKPTLLVVEGDPVVSAILWTLLNRFDFEVISENSGPVGRDLARNLHPDAIVLNVNLPGMNGLEICRQLKADPETRALPVLFCSRQHYLADEAMEVGAAAFLVMPDEVFKLPDCLRQIFARADSRPESANAIQQASGKNGAHSRT
jgi:DNA-binding response OmpR family regulator